MTEKKQDITLIVEYFKSLREEIHLRIMEHTRLVWIKTISLGTIMSFLIGVFYGTVNNSETSTYPLSYLIWILPLAAVIFDMLIAGNLRVINNLGYYIKKYIEGKAFYDIKCFINERLKSSKGEPDFGFWEEKAAQASLEYHCYTKEDMFIIWLFTLSSWIFSGLLRGQIGFNFVDIILAVVCGVCIGVGLWLLIQSITMERRF